MAPPEILRLSFPDQGALEREIATNIRYGRLFVGHVIDLPVLSEGVLVIVHPVHGRELHLLAQIVMVNTDGPMRGTGLALRSFGPDEAERVTAFVHDKTSDPAEPLSLAPEPRVRISTPAPEPRVRVSTPPPSPRTSAPPQAAPRASTLPEARRATVPPVSPENDWSDLPTTGLTRHPALQAKSAAAAPSEAPAPAAASVPAPSDVPFAVIVPAVAAAPTVAPPAEAPATAQPPMPASDEDDWSDVARAMNGEPEPEKAEAHASGEDAGADDANAVDGAEAADDAAFEDDPGTGDESPSDDAAGFDEDPNAIAAPPAPTDLQQSNRQERLRSLNVVEQLKIARRGELSDRVVVERLYGKTVWEALLQNPRLTLPEVARIARKGTVPRPLIEQIVGNATWTKAPNVRRALLSNPKLTQEGVLKLLALTPKHELKILEKATAYPMAVRDAARKILRES